MLLPCSEAQTEATHVLVLLSRALLEPGSPAARLGLNSGQAILEVNFESIASVKDFEDAVEAARENGRESVLVSVRLNRQTSVVALSIEED